jgi:uncharacterized protein
MVGRQEELRQMKRFLNSKKPEIVMLTGRRRVGKTYIIQQAYKQDIVFSFTGTKNAEVENQLKKFETKLQETAKKNIKWITQTNWADAFTNLNSYLNSLRKTDKKRVVFFDEFPWICTAKSNFLEEFGYWWNDYGSKNNILVAISGSDTAWMIHQIINNKESMHGRVTRRIHLQPFTLAETKEFVLAINPRLTNYDILELYMCMGGIPLYLEQIEPGQSVAQSIYYTCFKKNGFLHQEFTNLYASLFDNYEGHIAVIKALSTKWKGLTRSEIVTASKIADGGGLNRILTNLEACNLIMTVQPFQNKKKGMLYRLADEYSKFYIHFIEKSKINSASNWINYQASNKAFKAWQAYSFESICIKHANAVKQALGISGVFTEVGSYYKAGTKTLAGFQIDMLIDRADNAMNICEIKFYNKPIVITKTIADDMRLKRANFIEFSKNKKAIFNTIIATYGIDRSDYQGSEIDTVVNMDSLFLQKRFE